MKKAFRFFGRELKINFSLSFRKVKRISYDIPEWGDDAHLRHGDGNTDTNKWGTPDGKDKVVYYRGTKVFFMDVPECKESVEVFCSPMKEKVQNANGDWSWETVKDRKLIVDLYF